MSTQEEPVAGAGRQSRAYTPELSQVIQTTNHPRTGRMRWAKAIYAADGTLLDVMPYDDTITEGWPLWTAELTALPCVNVAPGEFAAWLRMRALAS